MNEHYEHYLVPIRKGEKEKEEKKEKGSEKRGKPAFLHKKVRNMLTQDLKFTEEEISELESILDKGPIEEVFKEYLEKLKKAVKSHYNPIIFIAHPDSDYYKTHPQLKKRLDDKFRKAVKAKHFFDKVSKVNQLFTVEPPPANVEGPLPYDYDKHKKRPGEGWQIWGPGRL